MRRLLSSLVLLAGLLLAGVGLVVGYLARTVLDEDAFGAHVVAALDEPAVSAFVAGRIADGVIAANPDLTGVRPVLATLATGIVRSAPFQVMAGRAAREAHRLAFSSGAREVLLAAPDVGALLRSALGSVSPEAAERIPPNLRTLSAEITGERAARVLAGLRVAARIRNAARGALLVGLLLIPLALMISPIPRQTLLEAGIGVLAIAAVLALSVPLGRAAITAPITDPALRAVAGELWFTFAGGLRQWAVGIAAVALMLLSAVAALLDASQVRRLARRAWESVSGRQPTPLRELARIGVLITAGVLAVVSPNAVLTGATVTAGLVVIAVAVYLVVDLVAPARPTEDASVAPLRFHPALSIATGGVALALAGLGSLAVGPRVEPSAPVATAPVTTCNGDARLCERRLDQVVLAGAHNAMGAAEDPTWMFPNQDRAIPALLDAGVRALLVDVHVGHPVQDRIKTDFQGEDERAKYEKALGPEGFAAAMRIRDRLVGEGGGTGLYLCHGFCELGATPFDTALAQVRRFLETNPGEVILLVIEDYAPAADVKAAFARQGLEPLVYPGPWTKPLPTLGSLVASGHRLLVLGEHLPAADGWYVPAFDVLQETPYTFRRPEEFSCRPNRGGARNPLFLMNHWIETTPAPRPSNATIANAESLLVARARECRRVRGKLPNVLAVDFAGVGDVVRAAAVLNGLEAASGN